MSEPCMTTNPESATDEMMEAAAFIFGPPPEQKSAPPPDLVYRARWEINIVAPSLRVAEEMVRNIQNGPTQIAATIEAVAPIEKVGLYQIHPTETDEANDRDEDPPSDLYKDSDSITGSVAPFTEAGVLDARREMFSAHLSQAAATGPSGVGDTPKIPTFDAGKYKEITETAREQMRRSLEKLEFNSTDMSFAEARRLGFSKINARIVDPGSAMPQTVQHTPAEFPVEDWQYEVANGDTRLGYLDWVKGKKEANAS